MLTHNILANKKIQTKPHLQINDMTLKCMKKTQDYSLFMRHNTEAENTIERTIKLLDLSRT